MLTIITAINFDLGEESKRHINRQIEKIDRLLPGIQSDLPIIEVFMRVNRAKGYFEGTIVLRLPIKVLAAKFEKENLDEGLKLGFDHIFRELDKYKSEKNSGDSEYPDQTTIR